MASKYIVKEAITRKPFLIPYFTSAVGEYKKRLRLDVNSEDSNAAK